jgi:putative peptide zinc metalloprotease protein
LPANASPASTPLTSSVKLTEKFGLNPELPRLRQELTLHIGPTAPDGSPTWTIHDPVRNQYFALNWLSVEVIKRLHLGSIQKIQDDIEAHTPFHLETEQIEQVLEFLQQNELITRHDAVGTEWFIQKRQLFERSVTQQLIHSYLFFRLPLFHPDALLERLLPSVQFLFSRWFVAITFIVFLVGCWGIFRQWSVFTVSLVDTFSWEGIATYLFAVIVIKVLHEFGHALTAKRLGCRVPTMGIAFLVMFPMAYTDVTESWKLDSHRKRFAIASAGIATELVVAAWMLFLWTLLPEGNARGIAFFLATTSITMTLLVNASPFMRFDGYFLLSDLLNMPNLHQRCFSMARWWLREKLFQLGDDMPEPKPSRIQHFMVWFAFSVWLYRFLVFLGIAVLVYHFFFKALGIVLFIIEIWYFIVRPVWTEALVWFERRGDIGPAFHRRPVFYVLLIIGFIFFVPFDFFVNTQGVLKPAHSLGVILDRPVIMFSLPKSGDTLRQGDPLFKAQSLELEQALRINRVRQDGLRNQIHSTGMSDSSKALQSLLREQLSSLEKERDALLADQHRLNPVTPFDGRVVDVLLDVRPGDTLPKGTRLLTLIEPGTWVVDTYVDESDLDRIKVGSLGRFIPDTPGRTAISARVAAIDRDASRHLSDAELAAPSGGNILVRRQSDLLIPERSIYRVRLVTDDPIDMRDPSYLRGSVIVLGWPRSLFGELIRGVSSLLVRELGF